MGASRPISLSLSLSLEHFLNVQCLCCVTSYRLDFLRYLVMEIERFFCRKTGDARMDGAVDGWLAGWLAGWLLAGLLLGYLLAG